MGYSTDYHGVIRFKQEPTASQLAHLNSFLEKDRREIMRPDGRKGYGEHEIEDWWHHIDLQLTDDFGGLEWNGHEKTGPMHAIVNFLTDRMRERWPDFAFEGKMDAQGEEIGDVWQMVIGEDGRARRVDVVLVGKIVTCPHCGEKYILEPQD
jgi:hypothetical protein